MITVQSKGDFKNLDRFLKKSLRKGLGLLYKDKLERYGQLGVEALSNATPIDTGLTAASWNYEIEMSEDGHSISVVWYNTNVQKGYANVALLLEYGHGTRNGGWVEGLDYINPTLAPIFERMANAAWKEVTSA